MAASTAAPAATSGISAFGMSSAAPATGLSSVGLSAPSAVSTAANTAVASAPTSAASNAGFWGSLGEGTKAGLAMGGINTAGQMISGYASQRAQEKAEEEARRRMTYFGMDGDGNLIDLPTYGQMPAGLMTYSPGMATPGSQFMPKTSWQTTMDEIIARQKNLIGG